MSNDSERSTSHVYPSEAQWEIILNTGCCRREALRPTPNPADDAGGGFTAAQWAVIVNNRRLMARQDAIRRMTYPLYLSYSSSGVVCDCDYGCVYCDFPELTTEE